MAPSHLTLAILYDPPDGPPLRIVSVDNHSLLMAAAEAALAEAEERAGQMSRSDALLVQMQVAEADRVRRILSLILGRTPQKRGLPV